MKRKVFFMFRSTLATNQITWLRKQNNRSTNRKWKLCIQLFLFFCLSDNFASCSVLARKTHECQFNLHFQSFPNGHTFIQGQTEGQLIILLCPGTQTQPDLMSLWADGEDTRCSWPSIKPEGWVIFFLRYLEKMNVLRNDKRLKFLMSDGTEKI